MQSTMIEIGYCILCAFGFSLFLLAPGYLAARLSNIKQMRERSASEQLLWSISLSIPLALLLAELLGRILPSAAVISVFLALSLIALVIVAVESRKPHSQTPTTCETKLAALAAVLLGAYLILTLIDFQVGQRLFMPTTIPDWSVRIPLMESAIRSGVPPANGLSALDPTIPSMRYYYFWYVLCAFPARLLHAPADAVFIASSVWAGFALLAVAFLSLKYLAGVRTQLRRKCLLVLLPMMVIGLDILPAIAVFLSHSGHPQLDLEWWRGDRTPGLLTALVYAPHHIAGLVSCFVAILVIVAAPDDPSPTKISLRTATGYALLTGAGFAACVGTSTFIAFIFVIACTLWAIDLAFTRQFSRIGTLAVAGIVSYLLSRPFLHELKSGSSAAHGFASFAWRSNSWIQEEFNNHNVSAHHPIAALFARPLLILILTFFELGFFAFVAVFQFRRQLLPALRGQLTLTPGQRVLWAIFFGAATVALFVSSAVTSSVNDLGQHAAMITRFILILWSPPYLTELFQTLKNFAQLPVSKKLIPAFAATCLALGLLGCVTDAILHRIQVPLFDAHIINGPFDMLTSDHLGERFLQIRTTWRDLDPLLPANARVEFDPLGKMEFISSRFSNRQVVASDGGCGTAFGGDYDACAPVILMLRHLYGSETETVQIGTTHFLAKPETTATAAEFDQACRTLNASAFLVDSTSEVWNQPNSWVWTLKPAVAQPTVRAFLCPPQIQTTQSTSLQQPAGGR
jgi:hypothetical protein